MNDDLLMQRLDRLERENRLLKRWAGFLLVGCAVVVLMGQATPRAPLKVVEAERIILMGRSGKPRAVLGEGADGNVGLRFVGATTGSQVWNFLTQREVDESGWRLVLTVQ